MPRGDVKEKAAPRPGRLVVVRHPSAAATFAATRTPLRRMQASRIAIITGLAASAAGLLTAPMALAAGIAIGVLLGNPWLRQTSDAGRLLLQTAVVGLGFGLALDQIWAVGPTGLVLTALVVLVTLVLGLLLGRLIGVPANTASLVSVGTAICGGSAIAAIAPILKADDEEVGAALATVFTLNAAGLFLFPRVGRMLDLPELDFGYWAALAIHDTSSVVAAGSVYGATALGVATTVKLTRAAWIAPVALVWASARRSEKRARFPWFILGFVIAALIRSAAPALSPVWDAASGAARHLLVVVLFLIGTGMTRDLLRRTGMRPLLQGAVLWLATAAGVLLVLRLIVLPG